MQEQQPQGQSQELQTQQFQNAENASINVGRESSHRPSNRRGFRGGRGAAARLRASLAAEADNDASTSNADTNICFICAEKIQYYAVSSCNHRTCHICCLRLRALYKTQDCTFCKTEQRHVIFTTDPEKQYQDYKTGEIPYTDKKLNISCETEQMLDDSIFLLKYNCPDPACVITCEAGWPALRRHCKQVHNKLLCTLCTQFKKVFAHEQSLFTKNQLDRHFRQGDQYGKSGFKGHPQCEFCQTSFYGDDELYEHCRDRHQQCEICKKRGIRHEYYVDYDALAEHFRQQHYLCNDPECLAQKVIVFETDIDLKAHEVEIHGSNFAGQRAKHEARRIEVNISYSDSRLRTRRRSIERELPATSSSASLSSSYNNQFQSQLHSIRQLRLESEANRARNLQLSPSREISSTEDVEQTNETQSSTSLSSLRSLGETRVVETKNKNDFPALNQSTAQTAIAKGSAQQAELIQTKTDSTNQANKHSLYLLNNTSNKQQENSAAGTSSSAQLLSPLPQSPSINNEKKTDQITSLKGKNPEQPASSNSINQIMSVSKAPANPPTIDDSKLSRFKSLTSAYKKTLIDAKDFINDIWPLFNKSSEIVGKVVSGLADLLDSESSKKDLLSAWEDRKATLTIHFPTLGSATEGSKQQNIQAKKPESETKKARVLVIKSSTHPPNSPVWDRNLNSAPKPKISHGKHNTSFPTLAAATVVGNSGINSSTNNAWKGNRPQFIRPESSKASASESASSSEQSIGFRRGKPITNGSEDFPSLNKTKSSTSERQAGDSARDSSAEHRFHHTPIIFDPNFNSSLSQYLQSCPQLFGYRLTEVAQQKILARLFSEFWSRDKNYAKLFFPNGFGEGSEAYKLIHTQSDLEVEYSPAQRGKACGHIFKKGEGVYRCRNCSLDATCVFCSRCYHATNHEGHDISFSINNGHGGCCDCGDPEAWKVPIRCTYHSPDPSVVESLESEKKRFEENLPQDLIISIHNTVSTVFEFILDTLSTSPKEKTPPRSVDEVKQEALTTTYAIDKDANEDTEQEKLFAVLLWNDEHHSFHEVIDQVTAAIECSNVEARRITERVDFYGRDIVEISENIQRLLEIARQISSIGLAVTIRSARDTFREEMCGLLIDWLKDLATGQIGTHPTILRDIICKELTKEWKKDHSTYYPHNALRLKNQPVKPIQPYMIKAQPLMGVQDNIEYMIEDDVMERSEEDESGQIDQDQLSDYNQSGGDYEMIAADELLDETEPMDEDDPIMIKQKQKADDFLKVLRLDVLLTLDHRLWKDARSGLRDLYISTLIINSEYKKILGIRFVRNYMKLVDAFLTQDREPEHSIILFTVQLFTVPTIATILVKNYNFLSTIFTILRNFFIANQIDGLGNIESNAKLNCESDSFKNRRYFHIFCDLRYIIGMESVRKIVSRNSDNLQEYLDLIGLFQGMNPNIRATQQHVEYESDSWMNAFNVTLQLAKSCRQFSSCYISDTQLLTEAIRKVLWKIYLWSSRRDIKSENEEEKMDVTSDNAQEIETSVNRIRGHTQQTHDIWSSVLNYPDNRKLELRQQEFHEISFPSNPYIPTFKVVKFNVASQPVSFHHPLHWFLGELLEHIELLNDEALVQHGWDSFQDMMMSFDVENDEGIDKAKEKILEIFDYPLRVLVLLVQIRSGLWVRNGFGIRGQCLHYREVSLRENTYDEDIFLIQTAFILNEPNLILATILDRFDMVDWFCGKTSHQVYDNLQMIFMAEELLTLLIVCASERGIAAGLTNEQKIRREIIHSLCLSPLAYSELIKRIPERLHEEISFDEILGQLATYRNPDSLTDHGTYELRDEFYDEVDPYFVHYSRNNREETEEALKNRLKKKWEASSIRSSASLIIPKLIPITNGPFVRLGNFLQARLMNQIIFYALWHVKNDKIKSDTLIDEALHLVMLALIDENNDIARESKRKGKQKAASSLSSQNRINLDDKISDFMHYAVSDYFPVEIDSAYHPEGINLLTLLLQLSIDSISKEFLPKFEFIINNFETNGSEDAKLIIRAHREKQRAELQAREGKEKGLSDFERKKLAAKERQAKIMEQFAKAQKSFIEKHEDLYEEDEEMDEDWEVAAEEGHLGDKEKQNTETIWSYPTGTCILCQEETNLSALYGMLGLIQPSNMLRITPFHNKDYVMEVLDLPESLDRKYERNQPFGVASKAFSMHEDLQYETRLQNDLIKGFPSKSCKKGLYASTCGHLMHVKCFETYFASIEQRHQSQLARNHPEEATRKEFMCPLCRSLGNALLPIVWKGKRETYPGILESKVDFEKWLNEGVGDVIDDLSRIPEINATPLIPGIDRIRSNPSAAELTSGGRSTDEFREMGNNVNLPDNSQNTQRRRNSSSAGRIREVITQFVTDMWRAPPALPAVSDVNNAQEINNAHMDPSTLSPAAVPEEYDHESMRRIYVRLYDVVLLAYQRLPNESSFIVNDNTMKGIDILWNLYSYTISCVEINQRGIDSLSSEGLPATTLLDGINTKTLTLLKIISETIPTYSDVTLKGASSKSKLKRITTRRLSQLFYGCLESQGQQTPMTTTTGLGGKDKSIVNSHDYPLLLEDSFIFLSELCVTSPDYGIQSEVHNLMHLMYYAELVRIVIAVSDAVINEQAKAWCEDARLKRKYFTQTQQQSSSKNKQEASNLLRDFIVWTLEQVGNNKIDISNFLGGMDELVLEKMIHSFCLPYLRKCVILMHTKFGVVFPKAGLEISEAVDEFTRLSQLLRLPSIKAMCATMLNPTEEESTLVVIVSGWCKHLKQRRIEVNRVKSTPLTSQTISFGKSLRKVCRKCKTVPNDPALCLLCGTFLCFQSYCCSERDSGECNLHARSCGGDVGIYFLVKKWVILLLHLNNGCFMNPPYLDKHGEVDLGLKRGRPQFLNLKRYDEFRNLWLTHEIPIRVARKIEQSFDLGGWSTFDLGGWTTM
ncbi:1191_t:CDS:10 [Ambispora leptoticha]|uniref:E3 ubiquitin-protein ligase n=1 Tax=Ambispora leptoticha TaxID=144679 RepID=A0A9N8VT78_9GLOM|nr:1191_t:CDS:10 [Ambispora leptoticha]